MKVRIGYGLGTRSTTNDQERFSQLVDGLEHHRFDSLWLSERLGGDFLHPLVGFTLSCGRTKRLKVGMSVLVLPGRNPVVLAKSIASLDRLSGGRVLPAFGLGVADSGEHQAFGVEKKDRGGWFNEALPLVRRLWAEDKVTHEGKRFHIQDVTVRPKPIQSPMEVWLGGMAPLELRRVGRHGDGWLPSFCTADQVVKARSVIEQVADEHDREIEDEHFGALIPYRPSGGEIDGRFMAIAAARSPDADPGELFPSKSELPKAIQRFIDVGFSKFVLVPSTEPSNWADELDEVATLVQPMEN